MASAAEDQTDALVSPEWLAAHAQDPKVRLIEIAGLGQDELPAYRAGHVPGAMSWRWKDMLWDPYMREFPSQTAFARQLGQCSIANDTTVVVYGEDVQFGFYAWWALRYCGHADVRVLDGGRYRWLREGRALTTEVSPDLAPVDYRPVERRESMRIQRDHVLAALGSKDVVILDARSPEEYSGKRVGGPGGPDVGAVRYGRIPGAVHLYYADLLNDDKSLKSATDIAALLPARGIGQDKDVIAYCRMSHRATVIAFALTQRLGFRKVRVYDGSWTEWGNLVGAPVER